MRQKILQTIFSYFQCMTQWVANPDNYNEYYCKAEALIELLEIEDCGSTGGFDRINSFHNISGFRLYDRFITLIRKEKTILNKETYFTVEDMAKYWKQLINLRETYNK